MTDEEIKILVGKNITYFRTKLALKQTDLAELINYSDKSISKWERGDGIPDVTVLYKLSEIFNVSINEFFDTEHKDINPHKKRKHILIPTISIVLTYFIATILFVGMTILKNYIEIKFLVPWLVFIWAIPFSAIIGIVFSKIRKNRKITFLSVSVLTWSIALCLHLTFTFSYYIENFYLVYLAALLFQIIIVLWFLMKKRSWEK